MSAATIRSLILPLALVALAGGAQAGPIEDLLPPPVRQAEKRSMDGQLFAWRAEAGRAWTPRGEPLSKEDLENLWDTLRGDDARDLFGCQQVLAAAPEQVVPFLQKQLKPVPRAEGRKTLEDLAREVRVKWVRDAAVASLGRQSRAGR